MRVPTNAAPGPVATTRSRCASRIGSTSHPHRCWTRSSGPDTAFIGAGLDGFGAWALDARLGAEAAEEGGSLAGRDALGRFTGAGGYGAEAEAQGLSDYELATGQTVIRDQVRASLSEGGGGRFYDGLVRNADGTYTGIEVKSGSASLSASQRAFDEAVNGGAAARAMLNGEPINITSTELVRVR